MIRIGLDIGGTGIQIGAVNEENHIIKEASIPTRTDLSFAEQVDQMVACIKELLNPAENPELTMENVVSIGAGIPGLASSDGVVINCTNLGWRHVPLREEFQTRISKPFFVDNDANVAALAESIAGVSAGSSSSIFITLGTGIGSGIIIDGKIWKAKEKGELPDLNTLFQYNMPFRAMAKMTGGWVPMTMAQGRF